MQDEFNKYMRSEDYADKVRRVNQAAVDLRNQEYERRKEELLAKHGVASTAPKQEAHADAHHH